MIDFIMSKIPWFGLPRFTLVRLKRRARSEGKLSKYYEFPVIRETIRDFSTVLIESIVSLTITTRNSEESGEPCADLEITFFLSPSSGSFHLSLMFREFTNLNIRHWNSGELELDELEIVSVKDRGMEGILFEVSDQKNISFFCKAIEVVDIVRIQ